MDKKTILDPTTLEQLKQYIARKGFKEPGVMLDILDHFACKVEEKLEARPGLGLDEAMEAAHRDFGVSGFYPLAKNFSEQVRLRYKKLYRQTLKQMWFRPLFWFLAVATVCLYLPAYLWCGRHGFRHVLDMNDANLMVLLGFLVAAVIELRQQSRLKGDSFFGAVGQASGGTTFILVLVMEHAGHHDSMAVWSLVFNALLIIAGVLVMMARHQLFKVAVREQASMTQMAMG